MRELTPETSYGFDVVTFARDVLKAPLDPWQEWVVIHAGELLPDGRPRFRRLLVLVARQNGKTYLLQVLTLYWLFVEMQPLVLGQSTNLEYARETWNKVGQTIMDHPLLSMRLPNKWRRTTNGQEEMTVGNAADGHDRCRYKIAASNSKGGRSLTVNRLIIDELREHKDWVAYNASYPTMNAVPDGQLWAISNQGEDGAVVLDSLRSNALKFIATGEGDSRLGLFEYSAPDGSPLLHVPGWQASNPNLGRRIDADTIYGSAVAAQESGGVEESGFRTETLCQRVTILDAAIDPARWNDCEAKGSLRDPNIDQKSLMLCVDVSPDQLHVALVVAGKYLDGKVRVEPLHMWHGRDCMARMKEKLPDYARRITPRALGWFPNGPAAALAAYFQQAATTWDDREARPDGVPTFRVAVREIGAESASVCMGFAEQVSTGNIRHPGDVALNMHISNAEKLRTGDRWVFSRRGAGYVTGAYAAAGAAHMVATAPPTLGPPIVIAV